MPTPADDPAPAPEEGRPSRAAVITGGSGALGSALVAAFADAGWRVAFSWHRREDAARTLAGATGALAVQADLTRPEDAEALARAAEERFGAVDCLVNNAGLTQVMPLALMEAEDWDEVLAANLKTLFLATRAVARGMIHRRKGSIVNIGSLAGHRLLEVPVHYATAKAGVSGFTRAAAKELSRYGIRVNEIVPGLLADGVGNLVPERERKEYFRYCLAGRAGLPEEVAKAALFLAGDDAAYVNAQSLFVDGGM